MILVCGAFLGIPRSEGQYGGGGSFLIIFATIPEESGNPADVPGDCGCGDPISMGTGNVYEQVLDYSTPGQNQLGFTRFYNSLSASGTFAVSLGNNWRTNYDRYLDLSAAAVSVERADGQVLKFTQSGGGWVSNTDVDLTLTQNGTTWTLTDRSDTVETYTGISSSEAVLNSIQSRNGYTQKMTYNSGNQLTGVTDSYNRTLSFAYNKTLLQSVTTPDGLVLTYGFAVSGAKAGVLDQLTSVSYSTTPVTKQTYLYTNVNLPYALTGIIDENGNRFATWTYDTKGRGLSSQHAGGADLLTVSYDDATGNRTLTNALGQVSVFKFATLQGVPKLTEVDRQATSTAAAAKETFTYDSNGYTASVTDWNGNTTTYVNDVHGEPISITQAAGTPQARTIAMTYLGSSHLVSQVVAPGLTTNFTYDSNGELLSRTLTDTTVTTAPYSTKGQTRKWTYTWSNFNLASATAARTDVAETTAFSYDASGALTAMTNALGQATKITKHLPGGLPQTVVDLNGVTTNLSYDSRQRLASSTLMAAAGSLVTGYSYDATGNVLSVTQPDGSVLSNTYDAAHRLTATADLFKNSIAYKLDAEGNRTSITVANAGSATTRQHSATLDALGRILRDTAGTGQVTAFAYDADGNALTITDPLGRMAQQSFDALNRRVKITDAAQGNTTDVYDAQNRIVAVTDPNGARTSYTYDGFGDLIQEASPSRGTLVYKYDSDGNRIQKVDARGAVVNYTYDALDRLLTVNYPGDATENVTYTYDQAAGGFGVGRLTAVTDAAGSLSRKYDERGNLLSEARTQGTATLTTTYTYDAASRVTAIVYPSGWTVGYGRDAMGRITSMTTKAPSGGSASSLISNIAYQPFGPISALTYGNGIAETRTFDLDYRLTNLSATGTKPIQKLGYSYDPDNNVVAIADGVTSGNSQTFNYDALNRLTGAAGSYGNLGYSYDPNGNRLTENPSSAALPLDGLGGVSAAIYNQAGRLASVNAGTQQLTQYTYDGFGHRAAKTGTLTPATAYLYDQGGNLLEENNTQASTQADYIYLGNRPMAEISAGKVYFLHDDWMGTPQMATDSAQAAAWVGNSQPFGTLNLAASQTASLTQDLRAPGQENDAETGLYHNGFRDYAPGLGRYLESDPRGIRGGLNLHLYGLDNPQKFVDPSGLTSVVVSAGGGIIDTVYGASAGSGLAITPGPNGGVTVNGLTTTGCGASTQGGQYGAYVGLGVQIAIINGPASNVGGTFVTETVWLVAFDVSIYYSPNGTYQGFGVGLGPSLGVSETTTDTILYPWYSTPVDLDFSEEEGLTIISGPSQSQPSSNLNFGEDEGLTTVSGPQSPSSGNLTFGDDEGLTLD